jgi:pyruvate dehydrogenase E2 component (dihydrolipoamide acetyltransferase)
VLETEGGADEKASPAPSPQGPKPAPGAPQAQKPVSPAVTSPVKAVPPLAPKAVAAVPPPTAAPTLRAVPTPAEGERVRATPVTRKLAAEAGIDLSTIPGSGPAGRVLKSDVLALVENGGAKPAGGATKVPAGGEERIPLRGLRKRIAEKMQRSRRTAAHFTFVEEVDCTRLVETRKRINQSLAQSAAPGEAPLKISFLPFIIKATVAALKKFPYLNASVDDEKNEIVVKHSYNLGVAAATPDGLIVPVIHNADQRNLRDLALEIARLAGDARAGKSQLPDLQGGTFTITSMGEMGGLFATPVINHPEVAILGVHRMRPTPVVRDGQVVVRDILWLSCSFDHRIIDGAVGAQFTYEIIKRLEDPDLLLLELA